MTRFEVPGKPQGKGRPRAARTGGYVRMYTPERTREYEGYIRSCYMAARGGYYDGAVSVSITAVYGVPKEYSRARQMQALMGRLMPQTKPDIDNICKAVCDALNGLAYGDDRQITELAVNKRYGIEPKLIITVREAEEAEHEGN